MALRDTRPARRVGRYFRRGAATVALAGLTLALLPATGALASTPSELSLGAVMVDPVPVADALPAATRTSFLRLDSAVVADVLDRSAATGTPVGIDLFPDVHVSLPGTWDAPLTDGTRAWLGHGESEDGNTDAALVLRPEVNGLSVSVGTIWHDGMTYELRRVAPDVVAVVDLAPGAYTDNHGHAAAGESAEGESPAPVDDALFPPVVTNDDPYYESVADADAEAAAGSNAYVDVLVLYTPAAAAAADVRTRIKQYIANANLALGNEGLGYRFRIARMQQVAFTERPYDAKGDLDRVRMSASIADLRGDVAADLVAVVGSGWLGGSGICGYAYVNNTYHQNTIAEDYGYSIWEVDSSQCGSTTGAHELGHNLTLRHDWANDNAGPGSPFTYNRGYTSVAGDFRTVMGYDSKACPGGSCPRIPYWSNPNKYYNNVPRGMHESTPQPAHDGKALGFTLPEAARWFSNPHPFGKFEAVAAYPNGIKVRGWAADPDRRTGAISVQVWVDGQHISTGTANVYRSDVDDLAGYGSYHGFLLTVGVGGGTHTVCVRAVNVGFGTAATVELPSCRSITVPVDPVGALAGHTRIPGGARVTGWALDPDTTSAVSVTLSVDGTAKKTVTANLSSPRPPSSWADWGTNHGFSADLSLSSGVAHNVCATVTNIGEGVSKQVDCLSITVSGDPVGAFHALHYHPDGIAVQGWVLDPDTTASSNVQVTVDGVVKPIAGWTGGTKYTIPSTYSAYGSAHSFWMVVEGMTTGTHNVCVTAVNYSGTGGVSKSLGCKSMYYTNNPNGSFVATRTAATVVEVSGWAVDPNSASPINVKATFAGVVGPAVSANGEWSGSDDYPKDEYGPSHGFKTSGAVGIGPGSQEVCVVAVNVGAGADSVIGCTMV